MTSPTKQKTREFIHKVHDHKVQLRMRPLQKDVIARAAELKQTTMTNFMVEHAFSAAQQILADQPRELPELRKL